MKRKVNAVWSGDGADGTGVLSAQSGAFNNVPYSFKSRFKNDDGTLGTNPEELIAAALAGCFNMKLSFVLNDAGFSPENLETVRCTACRLTAAAARAACAFQEPHEREQWPSIPTCLSQS